MATSQVPLPSPRSTSPVTTTSTSPRVPTAASARPTAAMAAMARAGYPVGLTVAPIMAVEGWRDLYADLIERARAALAGIPDLDLTAELITHRFTPGSKSVLLDWYPATQLDLDETTRSRKTTKFGSLKFVYTPEVMRDMRAFFTERLADRLPEARVLYWT